MIVDARSTFSAARTTRLPDRLIGVAAVVVAAGVGVALVLEPMLAFLPVAALLSVLLLIDGRLRILFVLLGGFLVFQRGEGLELTKIGFLGLFSVAFVGAFVHVRSMRGTHVYRIAEPLLAASAALTILAVVSLPVAHSHAVPPVGGWMRDIAPYALLVSAPIFALDAQSWFSSRGLTRLLVAAGTVGAVAFAIHWLDRRNIAHVYSSQIGLASQFLAAALFCYGMSAALHGRRVKWLVVAAVVFAMLLVTGNRAVLVLLLAPLAIVFASRRHRLSRVLRLGIVGPITIAATVALAVLAVRATGADEASLSGRIETLRATASSSDASYTERIAQAEAAMSVFKSSPLLGAGPGTVFGWVDSGQQEVTGVVLDTPLTFPAKFGLFGLVILAFVSWKYLSFLRTLVRREGPTVAQLALAGYLAVIAGTAIGVSPLEDKGLSLGLVVLLALLLHESAQHSGQSDVAVAASLRP